MFRNLRRVKKYRRPGSNLIAAKNIQPHEWKISQAEVKEALRHKGCEVKKVKKIRYLKHQVCISFWDAKGDVCSSFFSYRIFTRWETTVVKLINCCDDIREWRRLNRIMRYEFAYYEYLEEMEKVLQTVLENRLYVLKATSEVAVFYES